MLQIGLIGFGHWGPNHVTVSINCKEAASAWSWTAINSGWRRCDSSFPMWRTAPITKALLQNPEVNAVVVSTPVATHHSLVKAALLAGKDVLVEKPIACASVEAQNSCNWRTERSGVDVRPHFSV